MRYLIDVAGDVTKLLYAVKTAFESPTDNPQFLWEMMVEKYGATLNIHRPRSAEPHFSFARELGLLAKRESSWNITPSGKAFLALYEKTCRTPKYFLIFKILENDRTFLLPFLKRLFFDGSEISSSTSKSRLPPQATYAAEETWKNLWKEHEFELRLMEPRIAEPKAISDRTIRHNSWVRLRFLMFGEGLGLIKEQLNGLVEYFWRFQTERMPDDAYFRIGRALNGKEPEAFSDFDLVREVDNAFQVLIDFKGFIYVSAFAAFSYVNEKGLPQKAVSWNDFLRTLERNKKFTLRTSFDPNDILFTISR